MKKNGLYLTIFLNITLHMCCNLSSKNDNEIFGQKNAVWIEAIYLKGYHPRTGEKLEDRQIALLAKNLKTRKIKYAYIFAGPYSKTGNLPTSSFSQIAVENIKNLQKSYPELVILPWVGGIQGKTVFLDNPVWVKNALMDTQKLTSTLNTKGIHIDLEYIPIGNLYLDNEINNVMRGEINDYGMNVNKFHSKLRKLLPGAFISSVVTATSPEVNSWKRKTPMSELQHLVTNIDQLTFLFYDTEITTQKKFESASRNLLNDIYILRNIKDIEYLIAIGSFINPPPLQHYRNMQIENISNTLQTLKKQSLIINKKKKAIDGIAVYCNWETDAIEWQDFLKNW